MGGVCSGSKGGSSEDTFGEKRIYVNTLFMGLDGAGKTTILYYWKTGAEVPTVPTTSFHVEEAMTILSHFLF